MRLALLLALAVACSDSGSTRPDYKNTGILEMVFTFGPDKVRAADVRPALPDAELMEMRYEDDGGKQVDAIMVRVPLPVDDRGPRRDQAAAAIQARYGTQIFKLAWSGDRLILRTSTILPADELRHLIEAAGPVVVDLRAPEPDDVTGEYHYVVKLAGPEAAFERAIEARLGGIDARVLQVSMVGPKGVR